MLSRFIVFVVRHLSQRPDHAALAAVGSATAQVAWWGSVGAVLAHELIIVCIICALIAGTDPDPPCEV